jgi:tRNA G18 (ribose-2'-O)-methylase SpoU
MENTIEITSVKLQSNGWLLNGNILVPDASGNREREAIMAWIADGNIPEQEFTDAELEAISKEQTKQETLEKISKLEASQLRSIRELMLDQTNAYAKAKLEDIEAQIQVERSKL